MKYSKMMQRLHLCRETSSRIEEDSENKKSHLVCVVPPPLQHTHRHFEISLQLQWEETSGKYQTGKREGRSDEERGDTGRKNQQAEGVRGRSASARINFPDPEFISSISTEIEAHTPRVGLDSCQAHADVHLSLPSFCIGTNGPCTAAFHAQSSSLFQVEHSSSESS